MTLDNDDIGAIENLIAIYTAEVGSSVGDTYVEVANVNGTLVNQQAYLDNQFDFIITKQLEQQELLAQLDNLNGVNALLCIIIGILLWRCVSSARLL